MEISLAMLAPGKTTDDIIASFQSGGGGLPDPAASPFEFLTFVYDARQDRTITVDLAHGQWIVGAADPEHPSDALPDQDPFAVMVEVR